MKFPASLALLALATTAGADPLITSWITQNSTKYARIYTSDANKLAGSSVTTWSNTSLSQSLPAYCGVQAVSFSDSWVYVTSSGLGSLTMGPWYNDASRTTAFINLPVNQKDRFRVPRTPVVPTTKSTVQGEIGFFVDGIHAFDSTDATSYSNTKAQDGDPPGTPNGVTGDGVWNRDAYVNEAITFDPLLAHQQNTGLYHYHANPLAPRYLLGDHIDYSATTKLYSESTATPTKHSPIIGWAKDGYPIYGPYGYSTATDATSGVRRMVCGYVPRNGSNGTTNLASTGRHTLPAWAVRVQGGSTTLASTKYGPGVSTSWPLGRYIEDNDYLGDLGKTQGVDFDLDDHNGRLCVTPEYPSGTYAYFVAITSAGAPTFPYNVGRQYYGTPTGGSITSVTETVTTAFAGGPDKAETMSSATPGTSDVAIVWNSTEGGTYKVEATSDLLGTWSTLSTTAAATANSLQTPYTETGGATGHTQRYYRVTRTALATYDPVTSTTSSGTGILSVSPTSGSRGTTFTLTVNLDSSVNPPPQTAPINSLTLGTLSSTSNTHVSSTKVTGSFTIPAGAATGAQTVTLVFPGPPGNSSATVTYSLANAFTITATAGSTALGSTAAAPTLSKSGAAAATPRAATAATVTGSTRTAIKSWSTR